MAFNFFKKKPSRKKAFNYRRASFSVRKSRVKIFPSMGKGRRTQKNPLISVRTPRLVVSGIRTRIARIIYRSLFILLIAGLFYSLFFSEWLQVHSITIEGNKIVDKKVVLDLVEPFLHKKVFKTFPSNNFFLIPTQQIKKEILANFKRISNVSVERIFPGSLKIVVEEKKAVLIFCNNKGCFWVDGEGISYNQSSFFEVTADNGNLVVVRDASNSDIPLDSVATSPEYVNFANDVSRIFQEKTGKEIAEIFTPLPSALELGVRTKEGWTVALDISLNLDRSLGLLMKIIDQEVIKGKNLGSDCLESVDLRLNDRIFYKLRPECIKSEEEKKDGSEEVKSENLESEVDTITPPAPVEEDSKKKKKKKT